MRNGAFCLQAGELAYRDRLAELRLVKARVAALRRDLAAAKKQGAAAGDLKREVQFLGKRLLHEEAKTKALAEELETPLNVHRCLHRSRQSWWAESTPGLVCCLRRCGSSSRHRHFIVVTSFCLNPRQRVAGFPSNNFDI